MNKNSIVDYVGRLRTKPEHVRKQIVLGTAVGTTVVVAAAWLFFLVSSGTLDVNPVAPATGTLAQGNAQVQQATTQTKNGFQNLMSAVGFATTPTASSAPALTIVDTSTSSPSASSAQSDNQSPTGGNQTVIPF
jgi:hypothetical protein